jgi:hypothetical protein
MSYDIMWSCEWIQQNDEFTSTNGRQPAANRFGQAARPVHWLHSCALLLMRVYFRNSKLGVSEHGPPKWYFFAGNQL